jgi:hypothetical protein
MLHISEQTRQIFLEAAFSIIAAGYIIAVLVEFSEYRIARKSTPKGNRLTLFRIIGFGVTLVGFLVGAVGIVFIGRGVPRFIPIIVVSLVAIPSYSYYHFNPAAFGLPDRKRKCDKKKAN